MRDVIVYVRRNYLPKTVNAINDVFGIAVAEFNRPYRPGEIAARNVFGKRAEEDEGQHSRFRIVREVPESEVVALLSAAGKADRPIGEGWWYEVIGD